MKKRRITNTPSLPCRCGDNTITQRGDWMKEAKYKTYDDLPLMLSVPDLVDVLGISRAGAYELVKSEGFPSLHIGNRVLVPKEELIAWIKANTNRAE